MTSEPSVDLANLRRSYLARGLGESDLTPEPYALFRRWLADAVAARVPEPNAMALATSTPDGRPSVRHVLLKGFDDRGFAFYTNRGSRKARELAANPWAALAFPWFPMERQVLVSGAVEEVGREETVAYWHTRPRESQLGAWASPQSTPVASRAVLDKAVAEMAARFPGEVPLPDFWGGFRVLPDTVEFWQGRIGRMHDRFRYSATHDRLEMGAACPLTWSALQVPALAVMTHLQTRPSSFDTQPRLLGGERHVEVSPIAIGAIPFGSTVSEERSFEILDRFVELGGTFIDTSNNYSYWLGDSDSSERTLGRWLAARPGLRDRLVLATKVGARPRVPGAGLEDAEGLSAPVIRAAVEDSLRRLGTDRIDVYYSHIEDRTVPLAETVGAFGELAAEGLVGLVGVSNHPTWRIEQARQIARAQGVEPYTCIQLRYSYLQPRSDVPFSRAGTGTPARSCSTMSAPSPTSRWSPTPRCCRAPTPDPSGLCRPRTTTPAPRHAWQRCARWPT